MHKYDANVRARWGDTVAYREYKKKTSGYNADQWHTVNDGFYAEDPHKIRLFPEFESAKTRRFSTLSQRNPEYLFPLISGRFRLFPLGNTSFPALLPPLFPCAPVV